MKKPVIVGALAVLVLVALALVLSNGGAEHGPAKPDEMSTTDVATMQQENSAITVGPTPALSTPRPISASSSVEPALVQAKKDFPEVSEEELKLAIKWGVNLKMIKEERVSNVSIQVKTLYLAMQQYRQHFKKYPEGSDADIAKALIGENADKIVFIDLPKKSRAATGEFVDPWGTAYNIRIENNVIAVRSAGPDGLFETKDDTVITK